MSITRLAITNLKNVNRSISLGEINLIVGANRTGKTAILDGITLSLLGYHPKLGKNKPDTFRLATPGATSLTVTTNERSLTWKKVGDTIKMAPDFEPTIPPILIDIGTFLGLTGPKKVAYIVGRAGASLKEPLDLVLTACSAVPELSKSLQAVKEDDIAAKLVKWLELASANLRDRKAEFDAIEGQIQASLLTQGTDRPKNVEKEIKSAMAEYAEAVKTNANITSSKKSAEERVKALEVVLAKATDEASAAKTSGEGLFKLERAVEENTNLFDEISKSEEAKSLEVRDAQKKQAVLMASLPKVSPMAGGKCPTCRREFTAESAEEFAGEVNDIESQLAAVGDVLDALKFEQAGLRKSMSAAVDKLNQSRKALSHAQVKIEEAKALNPGAIQRDLDDARQHLDGWSKAELKNDTEIASRIESLRADQAKYHQWKGVEDSISNAALNRSKAEQLVDSARSVVAAVKAAQKELLDSVIGKVVADANQLIEPVLGKALSFDGEFRLGPADLNGTSSGSEQAVVFAGLQLALTSGLPDRILIIDELGRMDRPTLVNLLLVVRELIKKKVISQFIGAMPGEWPVSDGEVNVIECGKEEA